MNYAEIDSAFWVVVGLVVMFMVSTYLDRR
jgi:hypothetical protein